jgi:hypothetical protein
MCLFASVEKSNKFLEKNQNNKFVWAYKLAHTGYTMTLKKHIRSPTYSGFLWKEGWNVSDRSSNIRFGHKCDDLHIVYNGIHVYSQEKESNWMHVAILEVKCLVADFIGTDWDEAELVFSKVYLPREEYRRVLREIPKPKSTKSLRAT